MYFLYNKLSLLAGNKIVVVLSPHLESQRWKQPGRNHMALYSTSNHWISSHQHHFHKILCIVVYKTFPTYFSGLTMKLWREYWDFGGSFLKQNLTKLQNYVWNGTSVLFLIPTLLLHTQAEPCMVYKYRRIHIAEGAACFSQQGFIFIYYWLFRFPLSSFLKQQFPKYQSRENDGVIFLLTSVINRMVDRPTGRIQQGNYCVPISF